MPVPRGVEDTATLFLLFKKGVAPSCFRYGSFAQHRDRSGPSQKSLARAVGAVALPGPELLPPIVLACRALRSAVWRRKTAFILCQLNRPVNQFSGRQGVSKGVLCATTTKPRPGHFPITPFRLSPHPQGRNGVTEDGPL